MAYTKAQLLEAVEDAIHHLLTGRIIRYRIEGTEFEKLSLRELREIRQDLKKEIENGGPIQQTVFEV